MKPSLFQKTFLIIIIFFIHSGLNVHKAYAAVPLENIHVNTTLDPSQLYNLDTLVVIDAGATLTIPAGTHIIFPKGSQMQVNGKLLIKGTADDHVVIVGGNPAPYIPLAMPQTMTETPATQSPEVSAGVMLNADAVPDSQRHQGIRFDDGSSSTLTYLDMQDATLGFTVDAGSTVTADHVTFNNCDDAILGVRGTLHLTNSSFDNVTYPSQWDLNGVFTHSNNTFSDSDGLKGWQFGGDMVAGSTLKLNSTDGADDISYLFVPAKASLVISPGVIISTQDNASVLVSGTFSADGTADKPITFQGNGACTTHSPLITFKNAVAVTIGHVLFNDLCSGIAATQSTLTMTNDSFNTIAGPAVTGWQAAIINASDITMNDVYQAFYNDGGSRLNLSNATIKQVNGKDAAIQITAQVPFSGNTISIDTAAVCVEVSSNSSMAVRNMTLKNCSKYGVYSTNNPVGAPSGFTMTDSEISNSGNALFLTGAQVTNISNNKFHDDVVGVTLKNMPATTIINNWWGSNAGPTIASNPGGNGDSIVISNVPSVTYKPWIGMAALEHNPIIIVPGITGSVLTKNYGDKGELWPNIATLALSPTDSFLNDLELLQDGTESAARPLTVGDIIRSAPGTDVFDGLIATLIKNGYKEGIDLFVMPYDWRLSNAVTQAQLKDAIANALAVSGKTKVNIIGHSMGGLLVKDYIAQNPTAPIDHLFFIATPNLGAPKAFKALMYGDDMGYNFSLAGALTIHVLNADRIKTITQNMPSVFELLPSKKYFDDIGSYVANNTYLNNDDTVALMKSAGRNAAMFPFATSLHDSIDTLNLSSIPTYNFVGCGQTKTIGKIVLSKKESFTSTGVQLTDAYHLQYVAGDGTVPRASATAIIGANDYFVNAGSHGTLPSTTQVENAIATILNGSSPTITNGFSTNPVICALSGEVVEVHSPVMLDVYDQNGRHTGPTVDGDIEYGIPNVDYETIGDDKFAFLPTGPTYKIVNHAQSTGSYDMFISHSGDDDTITNETYFHDVPLTTSNAVGTMTINPTTNYISMDEDGDGVIDSTIPPSATLSGSQANDITPPITTASVKDSIVTLSATDDNSGVLNTKYSLDGTTWNIYSQPFPAGMGTSVQFLSMDKAGNVENIKQVIVPKNTDAQNTSTQTPGTSASTINTNTNNAPSTTENNYYYDDNTPPSNDTTDTIDHPTSDDNAITPKKQDDADVPTDDTQTKDAVTSELPGSLIPTAVASSEKSLHSSSDNVPSGFITESNKLSDSPKKSSLSPALLLASAGAVVPTRNIILLILIGVFCILVVVIIRKQLFKKKSRDY